MHPPSLSDGRGWSGGSRSSEERVRSRLRGSGTLPGAVLGSAPHGGGDRSFAPFLARLHAPRRLVDASVGVLGRQQNTSGASTDIWSTEHRPDRHGRPTVRHSEGDARGAASAGGERDDPSEGDRHESLVLSLSGIDPDGSVLPHDRRVHEHAPIRRAGRPSSRRSRGPSRRPFIEAGYRTALIGKYLNRVQRRGRRTSPRAGIGGSR